MTPKAGMYTELTHDRPQDYQLMRDLQVRAVVLLQPDASKVSKVWTVVKNLGAKIVLRSWDLDDGRTDANPEGVYKALREHPAELGQAHAKWWRTLIDEMRADAQRQGFDFPPDSALICHLINEPDSNDLLEEIDLYTTMAVKRGASLGLSLGCYNFGTGHLAKLDATGKPDWTPLRLSLAAIKQTGMWVFLHEYYNSTGILQPTLNPWHVMRHWMAPLTGFNVAVTEWGLEELVNGLLPEHHGYQGRISNYQYGKDFYYYLTHCAPFVQFVCLFASDLPDRVWNSFDPLAAGSELIDAVKRSQAGEEVPSVPVLPPSPSLPPGPEEPATPSSPTIILPCAGTVTQRFGENYADYMKKFGIPGHNGLDIANVVGTPIVSIADGEVQWVGSDKDYGNYIRVWYPSLRTHGFFAHLSETLVQGGQAVRVGEQIGKMGSTGNSTGPHLHLELRMGEKFSYRDVSFGQSKGKANPEVVYALYGIYL